MITIFFFVLKNIIFQDLVLVETNSERGASKQYENPKVYSSFFAYAGSCFCGVRAYRTSACCYHAKSD